MSAQGDALSAERKRLNAVADRIPQHLIDGALAGGATAYPSGPLTPRETDVVVKAVAAFMSELNRDKAKAAVLAQTGDTQ